MSCKMFVVEYAIAVYIVIKNFMLCFKYYEGGNGLQTPRWKEDTCVLAEKKFTCNVRRGQVSVDAWYCSKAV